MKKVDGNDLGNELTVSVIESSTTQQQKEDHQIDTISPQDLFKAMTAPGGDGILVVDVRGKDHDGGHVPNSIHITTKEVCKNPGFLVSEIRQRKVTQAVFTCMYSVLRARKCSNALQEFQRREQSERHSPYPVQLKLLAGGFHGYINAFAHDISRHVEDYKEECWTKGPENLGLVHVMDALWSEGGQQKLIKNLEEELEKIAAKTNARNDGDAPESEAVTPQLSEAFLQPDTDLYTDYPPPKKVKSEMGHGLLGGASPKSSRKLQSSASFNPRIDQRKPDEPDLLIVPRARPSGDTSLSQSNSFNAGALSSSFLKELSAGATSGMGIPSRDNTAQHGQQLSLPPISGSPRSQASTVSKRSDSNKRSQSPQGRTDKDMLDNQPQSAHYGGVFNQNNLLCTPAPKPVRKGSKESAVSQMTEPPQGYAPAAGNMSA